MLEKYLNESGLERVSYNIDKLLAQYVPSDRSVNGKPLESDIVLTASDLNAATMEQLNDAVRENIREKWRDGWPSVWAMPVVETGRAGIAQISS